MQKMNARTKQKKTESRQGPDVVISWYHARFFFFFSLVSSFPLLSLPN